VLFLGYRRKKRRKERTDYYVDRTRVKASREPVVRDVVHGKAEMEGSAMGNEQQAARGGVGAEKAELPDSSRELGGHFELPS